MRALVRPTLVLFLILSAITGIVYPLLVTGVARVLFPAQAAGSLIVSDGRVVGSHLIGQSFSDPKYFWGRPSATSPMPYNGANSSGSNQGPTNPALVDAVKGRIDALRAADPGNTAPVPVDLVTASASGLDPEISVAAASTSAGERPRAFATRSSWYRAAATLISGSRPLPEAVTRSTGIGAVLPGSAALRASMRPLTASTSAGLVGPWFEPLELAPL